MFEVLLISESKGQHCNIAVHNATNGQNLSTFKGGISQAGTLCAQSDQHILSSVPNKPIIQAYDLSRKSQVATKIPVPGAVSSLTVSHDGALLAAGIKNDILVWELLSGDLLGVLSMHYQKITTLDFSHDDSYLAAGGEDGIVSVWDMADVWDDALDQVKPYHSWTCHVTAVTKVKFGLRYRLYSSSSDRSIQCHDIPSGCQSIKTIVFDNNVVSFCLNQTETFIYAGCSNGALVRYDLLQYSNESQPVHASDDSPYRLSVKHAHSKKITCIVCSMDGSCIITGSEDQEVKFWDSLSLQYMKVIEVNGPLTNLLLLPAYNGFTDAAKATIMPLPKLNRQLKRVEDGNNGLKFFHALPIGH